MAKTVIDEVEINGVKYTRKDMATSKPIAKLESLKDLIGKQVFIRTVTYHAIGRVVNIFDGFIELEDSSWIASSGRFMNTLKEGTLDEVEPTERMWVSVSSIVDFFEWKHKLPTEQI